VYVLYRLKYINVVLLSLMSLTLFVCVYHLSAEEFANYKSSKKEYIQIYCNYLQHTIAEHTIKT